MAIPELEEDLQLVSRIIGLRSRNAYAQAQTSKMCNLLTEWQGRQEKDVQQRMDIRRRNLQVLGKFFLRPVLPVQAFSAWRCRVRHVWRDAEQAMARTCLSAFSSWRRWAYEDRLASRLSHEAKASQAEFRFA
ncbi:unnamed protein product [Effrenium voratum]|nr:unnamed protein product [Effrenium voratum]